jgi:hypothetical protein
MKGNHMTNKALRRIALLGVAFAMTASVAVNAAQRTFVSTGGADGNTCSLAQPCRGFAKAITVTDPGGEIIVLDSGGYGAVVISQDVTITSPPGVYAGISVSPASDGITVAAPALNVALRGLTINGQGGNNGIVVQAGNVQLESVVVSNLAQAGIRVEGGNVRLSSVIVRTNAAGVVVAPAAGAARLLMRDSEISNHGGVGVNVTPTAGATALVTVERSSLTRNLTGVVANGSPGNTATLVVTQSVVSENPNTGVASTGSGATVYVRETAVTRNGFGFSQSSSAIFHACGSNLLVANTTAQTGIIDTTSCLDVAAISGPAGGDLAGNYPNPVIDVGAVTNSKLGASSVTSSKIAAGAVGSSEIAAGAVGNAELANDSVGRSKILGGNANGAISISLPANVCSDVNMSVSGAAVDDIPFFSLQGGESMPQYVLVMPLQVSAANSVRARFCNLSGSPVSFSGLGVSLLTIR